MKGVETVTRDIESYKQDIVDAAVAWRNAHAGMPDYISEYHKNQCQGYLYDRVRYYENAKVKQQEG